MIHRFVCINNNIIFVVRLMFCCTVLTSTRILKRAAEHDKTSLLHYCYYCTKSPLYVQYKHICLFYLFMCVRNMCHIVWPQQLPYNIELCTGALSKGVGDRGGEHVLIDRFSGQRHIYNNIYNNDEYGICYLTTNTCV